MRTTLPGTMLAPRRTRDSGTIGSRVTFTAGRVIATMLCLVLTFGLARRVTGRSGEQGLSRDLGSLGSGGGKTSGGYSGVLTFATTGNGDPFSPAVVQDLDLGSGELAVRFDGVDPTRGGRDELAFVSRLAGGHFADHGIVVVDARGVPGAPLHVCQKFNWSSNRVCAAPKLAPDGRFVAFAIAGAGSYCRDYYGMFWGAIVVVTDRRGQQVATFEGYDSPDWLPDGRLLMMGTQCRKAGIWMTDRSLGNLSRIDGDQVATPAFGTAVSPDGGRVAFVWNNQLWALTLTGQPELSQLTRLPKSVRAGAWSPDGKALAVLQFDVSMPLRSVVLFRPGDQSSVEVHPLPVYPYGPISWR